MGEYKKKVPALFSVFRVLSFLSATAVCILFMPGPVPAVFEYTELSPPGMSGAHAHGVNIYGDIVGDSEDLSGRRGFLYSGGLYTDLLPPGWTTAVTYDINDNGVISGSGNSGTTTKGFLYSGGVYTELLPPGWSWAEAHGINNSGVVAGSGNDGTTDKGFIFDGVSYTELLPPGWEWAEAYGINDSGTVAGFGSDGLIVMGFIFDGMSYTELIPPGWTEAYAYDINDSGEVAGLGNSRAFIYSSGVYTEIFPPGWDYLFSWSGGISINNNGAVAGNGYDGSTWKGFLYDGTDYYEILPTGWSYSFSYDLNDNGTAVGWGKNTEGAYMGFAVNTGISCLEPVVRIEGRGDGYGSVQAAYDDALNGDAMQSRAVTINENLYIDTGKDVSLKSGYNCDYSVITGKTVIAGELVVSDGVLTVESGTLEII